jgi:hypothetical protein
VYHLHEQRGGPASGAASALQVQNDHSSVPFHHTSCAKYSTKTRKTAFSQQILIFAFSVRLLFRLMHVILISCKEMGFSFRYTEQDIACRGTREPPVPSSMFPGRALHFYVFWMIQSAQWFLLSAVHAVVKYST